MVQKKPNTTNIKISKSTIGNIEGTYNPMKKRKRIDILSILFLCNSNKTIKIVIIWFIKISLLKDFRLHLYRCYLLKSEYLQ